MHTLRALTHTRTHTSTPTTPHATPPPHLTTPPRTSGTAMCCAHVPPPEATVVKGTPTTRVPGTNLSAPGPLASTTPTPGGGGGGGPQGGGGGGGWVGGWEGGGGGARARKGMGCTPPPPSHRPPSSRLHPGPLTLQAGDRRQAGGLEAWVHAQHGEDVWLMREVGGGGGRGGAAAQRGVAGWGPAHPLALSTARKPTHPHTPHHTIPHHTHPQG